LKIITWNCNGAFRKKFKLIAQENADIYIIQECENPIELKKIDKQFEEVSIGHLWTGDSKNKGLGVFVKKGICIEKINLVHFYNESKLKWFLPFSINNQQQIIAVWNHHGDSDEYRYIGQFWCFLKMNKEYFHDSIIIGDFNSNTIWDYKRSDCTHSNCVNQLKEIGLESIYHSKERIEQGKEMIHTFYLQKNHTKKYHIDYIFSPINLLNETKKFIIGDFKEWKEVSDHVPLIWEYQEKIKEPNNCFNLTFPVVTICANRCAQQKLRQALRAGNAS
jgi:exonuclease III